MTQTVFTDSVKVQGSQDTTQLQVQGNGTQTQPLQNWLDSVGNTKAQVTSDGRFQIGNNLGAGAPADALIQANNDITLPSSLPLSGWHTLGRLTGALSGAVNWVVHELQFLGTGGVSGLHTAMRARLTHSNTGSSTTAELRAADFQTINQTGSSGTPVYRATGLRGTASNATNAYLTKAVGVESTITNDSGATLSQASAFEVAPPVNAGTIGTLYGLLIPDLTQGATNIAIQSGSGIVRIGDHEEIKVLAATPTGNPPTGLIKLYPKLNAGIPTLYAKDANGSEYLVGGGGGGGSAPLVLIGQNDNIQLLVKGNTVQNSDLQQWQKSDGTVIATMRSTGSLWINGQSDDIHLFAQGSAAQTNDLFQLQVNNGTVVHSVSASGATAIRGQADALQLLVQGNTTQTANLQEWQNHSGSVLASISGMGVFTAASFGPIGNTTPSSGTFTNLIVGGQSDILQLVVKSYTTQINDLQQWQKSDGTVIATMRSTGSLWINGQSNDIHLFAQGSAAQTNDLFQLQVNNGTIVHSVSASGATAIRGQADALQLLVQGNTTQTANLQEWQNHSSGVMASINGVGLLSTTSLKVTTGAMAGAFLKSDASGLASWGQIVGTDLNTALAAPGPIGSTSPSSGTFSNLVAGGQSDSVSLIAKGYTTQTNDLQQWQKSDGTIIASVLASGSLWVFGQSDNIRLLVRGSATQTTNLQEWQNSGSGVVASISGAGLLTATSLTTPSLKMTTGGGAGKFLKSDAAGLGSWNLLSTADIATALTTPGPIGSSTPSTGAFTSLKATTGAGVGKFLKSDAAGLGSWNLLGTADIATALTTPGPIGSTTPSTGAFTSLKATTGAGTGKFLQSDASGNGTWQPAVTSVALTVPSFLSVVGSPVTTSGTLAVSLATQNANLVFAGPSSGGASAPTFRALAASDLATVLAAPPAIGGTTPTTGTFTTLTGTTAVAATLSDNGTTNVTNIGLLTHNSSGAVAPGLGTGLLFAAQSSTTASRAQGRVRTQWVTATDASRAAQMVFSAYDTAERDCLTIRASGTAPQIGFFGVTPAAQQTGGVKTAAVSYTINEQAMLQAAYSALRAFGLLS